MRLLRKAVFWLHLVAGVVAGVIILVMSATGVLLAYEKQISAWADGCRVVPPEPGAQRLGVEALSRFNLNADGTFRLRRRCRGEDSAIGTVKRLRQDSIRRVCTADSERFQPLPHFSANQLPFPMKSSDLPKRLFSASPLCRTP
jgi:uncharacterized iron-regulated membrane protein